MLQDKVILVTGGARGIGRAVVERCLREGAWVAYVDVLSDRLAQTKAELAVHEERFFPICQTVAAVDGVEAIVRQVIGRFGRIDGLVNNAAITRDSLLMNMSEKDWDAVIDTNLKGPFLCARAVVPYFLKQKNGRIVNLIAASGLTGNIGQTNYAAAKGGVFAMTLTWSRELRRENITVNAVIPAAWTEASDRIPKKVLLKTIGEDGLRRLRSRKPEQVAPLIAFLLSDEAAEITGQCFGIAGRHLTVWDFSRPALEVIAPGEEWTVESLSNWLDHCPDHPWKEPFSPWL